MASVEIFSSPTESLTAGQFSGRFLRGLYVELRAAEQLLPAGASLDTYIAGITVEENIDQDTIEDIDPLLMAEIGKGVLRTFFDMQAAETARREASNRAQFLRGHLKSFMRDHEGFPIYVEAVRPDTQPIFRQTNHDRMNLKSRDYSAVTGYITTGSFNPNDSGLLLLSQKPLDSIRRGGSYEVRVLPYGSDEPQVDITLLSKKR